MHKIFYRSCFIEKVVVDLYESPVKRYVHVYGVTALSKLTLSSALNCRLY